MSDGSLFFISFCAAIVAYATGVVCRSMWWQDDEPEPAPMRAPRDPPPVPVHIAAPMPIPPPRLTEVDIDDVELDHVDILLIV